MCYDIIEFLGGAPSQSGSRAGSQESGRRCQANCELLPSPRTPKSVFIAIERVLEIYLELVKPASVEAVG